MITRDREGDLMEYPDYLNLTFKDKMIYKACQMVYENNWSIRQAGEELDLAPSTVYRWINYCKYIDDELYTNLKLQLKRRKLR